MAQGEKNGANKFLKAFGVFAGVALLVVLVAKMRFRRRKTARFEEIASNPEIEFVEDVSPPPIGLI